MRTHCIRVGTLLFWVGLSTLGAVLYGVINDQITVTISPEYFSVFKRHQFALALAQAGLMDAAVRIQAVLVGALATWWFGLFLGIVLSISSTVGSWPALSTPAYLRAIGGILLFTLGLSLLGGMVGYLMEPVIKPDETNWPFLVGIQEVRRAFAVGFWHEGAYLGGFVGTIVMSLWVRKKRSLTARSL